MQIRPAVTVSGVLPLRGTPASGIYESGFTPVMMPGCAQDSLLGTGVPEAVCVP